MIQIQSLLRHRLKRIWPTTAIVHALVIDRVDSQFRGELEDLDFSLKVWPEELERWSGKSEATGIRRPTDYMLAEGHRRFGELFQCPSTLWVRVIQDTFIQDIRSFSWDLQALSVRGHRFLAGRMAYVRKTTPWNDPLGTTEDLCYVQGAVMAAPRSVWLDYYLPMPEYIKHYADDSFMSDQILQSGGELIEIEPSWVHHHGCLPHEAKDFYRKHLKEIDSHVAQAPLCHAGH